MAPTLLRGDVVRIEAASRLRRGDIIVVETDGDLVIHRLVALRPSGLVCCGDRRRRRDPPAPPEAVCGVAVALVSGRRLRGGLWWLILVRARFWLCAIPQTAQSFVHDCELLRRELAGSPTPWQRLAGAGAGAARAGATVLGPDEAARMLRQDKPRDSPDDAATAPAEAGAVLVPAGVYSALPLADRLRLLGGLAGREVVVMGHMPDRRLRLRTMNALRRAVGVVARRRVGEPGELTVRTRDAGWTVVRFFSPEQLEIEIEQAGGRDVNASVVSTPNGRLASVEARLPALR